MRSETSLPTKKVTALARVPSVEATAARVAVQRGGDPCVTFEDQSSHIAGFGIQVLNGPARKFRGIVTHTQQGSVAGRHGDFEAVQRPCHSKPQRLEVGFLPRPAMEKRSGLSRTRPTPKASRLTWRKDPFGDLERSEPGVEPFDVDPDLPTVSDRDHGQVGGMRQIETDRQNTGLSGERGLAVAAALKLQPFGARSQVPAEDHS